MVEGFDRRPRDRADARRHSASARPTQLDRVVVTASRKPERTLDAPATIFTVSPQDDIERSTATHVDQLRAVPGLDVASGGIIQSNVVARGFNALFSGDLMMLVDNRISFVPSLRVNVPSLIAPSREDVERIEVVLGPGAALYGPNAASGVMHIVTKSPFESRGTTIAVDGGERDFLRAGFRHATVIGNFGFKISGEVLSALDFPSVDSTEQQLIAARHGAPRDFGVRRNSLELRADYRPDSSTEIIATAGRGEIGRSLEPTGESGTAQVRNWVMSSYQLRARRGRAFGQIFFTQSDAGETTPLRSGIPLIDRSRQLVGQLQHGRHHRPQRAHVRRGRHLHDSGDWRHDQRRQRSERRRPRGRRIRAQRHDALETIRARRRRPIRQA